MCVSPNVLMMHKHDKVLTKENLSVLVLNNKKNPYTVFFSWEEDVTTNSMNIAFKCKWPAFHSESVLIHIPFRVKYLISANLTFYVMIHSTLIWFMIIQPLQLWNIETKVGLCNPMFCRHWLQYIPRWVHKGVLSEQVMYFVHIGGISLAVKFVCTFRVIQWCF